MTFIHIHFRAAAEARFIECVLSGRCIVLLRRWWASPLPVKKRRLTTVHFPEFNTQPERLITRLFPHPCIDYDCSLLPLVKLPSGK